ncbi:sugar transferase [Mesobacillus subterraneus]|uniref:sugar transferase n=1 Tax=Mesobacillus subterraneus TaxID=285983 RepID=UPI00203F709B|nr:sugar transferase [Mesobacillus subterraneus]MCM3665233.1 sugar transferase [Mesobacillus subterraneus]MCM3684246.1 sugar transferase [Mesobacillus subterraneus]
MKRLLDLISSILLLILLSPIILFTAMFVKVKLGAPVLFKQKRPGLYGKPFYLYKFRTMTDGRDRNGNLLSDKLRLTPAGQFLRKYSLDELPQLINVLKGELSLVGPRPLLMEYLPLYTKEQAKRHLVKPGITGLSQISGRNTLSWEEKFKLDVWYVQNQTFLLDLKILWRTVYKVIQTEGVTQPGNVTMEPFKGLKTIVKEGHG